jgi:hypothetical protein
MRRHWLKKYGKGSCIESRIIAGTDDRGAYQTPGALDVMRKKICTKMVGFHFVFGSGLPGSVSTEKLANLASSIGFCRQRDLANL